MEARVKIWLEQDGKLVLSDYRARLLRTIQESGSLAGAASELGLSYRRAWGKVRELEGNLGMRLVQSDAGGPGGGRSRLTDGGAALLQRYERFSSALRAASQALHQQYLVDESTDDSTQRGQQIEPVAGNAADAP